MLCHILLAVLLRTIGHPCDRKHLARPKLAALGDPRPSLGACSGASAVHARHQYSWVSLCMYELCTRGISIAGSRSACMSCVHEVSV